MGNCGYNIGHVVGAPDEDLSGRASNTSKHSREHSRPGKLPLSGYTHGASHSLIIYYTHRPVLNGPLS